jgi:WD40 repeat protein
LGGNCLQRWPLTVADREGARVCLGPVQSLITSQDVAGLCLVPGTRRVAFVHGDVQAGGMLDLDAPTQRMSLRGAMAASTVSASPNGQWLATGTWHSQDVVIWEAATGAIVTNLPVGTSATTLFSPDGRWLVTASGGQFTQWETRAWQARHRYAAEPGAGVMAFSPDARLLAIRQSDAEVLLLSPERGLEVARLPGELPWPLCFSPDGTRLAVVEDERRVRLWDLRRLRQELAALQLDWDLPPYPPAPEAGPATPLRIEVVPE